MHVWRLARDGTSVLGSCLPMKCQVCGGYTVGGRCLVSSVVWRRSCVERCAGDTGVLDCRRGLDREFGVLQHPCGDTSECCSCRLFIPFVSFFVKEDVTADGRHKIGEVVHDLLVISNVMNSGVSILCPKAFVFYLIVNLASDMKVTHCMGHIL